MSDQATDRLDLKEKGGTVDGVAVASDRRLFMQLLAYGECRKLAPLVKALSQAAVSGVLYEDIHDPQGVALVAMSEDPGYFLNQLRPILNQPPFDELRFKAEYAMLGRTYALGYETDLDETLVNRPRRRLLDPELPWGIWYPLRRSGSFERLSAAEQRVVLMEHGGIGRAFGRSGYGHDIRLACHGLDKSDNDFVIGLVGAELYPLSAIVQRMRKTKQTSTYLDRLGPFFVGKAIWQSENSNS